MSFFIQREGRPGVRGAGGHNKLTDRHRAFGGRLKMASLAVIRGADPRRIRRLDSKRSCPVRPAAA